MRGTTVYSDLVALLKLLAIALLALNSAYVSAQTANGSHFLIACEAAIRQLDGDKLSAEEIIASQQCSEAVVAGVDSLTVARSMGGAIPGVCLPQDGISNDQGIRIFVKYLRENPQALQDSGRATLITALAQTYPCK